MMRPIIFVFLACVGLAASANERVALKSGGAIVKKENHQIGGSHCRADRAWIELEDLPDEQAQKRINADIRREITADKKLSANDCEGGIGDYSNSVFLTGVQQSVIGVVTTVQFGGGEQTGAGSVRRTCTLYSLRTGKKYDLKNHLREAGKAAVAKNICESSRTFSSESSISRTDKYCTGISELEDWLNSPLAYCLADQGVSIALQVSTTVHEEVMIKQADIDDIFSLPEDLKVDWNP